MGGASETSRSKKRLTRRISHARFTHRRRVKAHDKVLHPFRSLWRLQQDLQMRQTMAHVTPPAQLSAPPHATNTDFVSCWGGWKVGARLEHERAAVAAAKLLGRADAHQPPLHHDGQPADSRRSESAAKTARIYPATAATKAARCRAAPWAERRGLFHQMGRQDHASPTAGRRRGQRLPQPAPRERVQARAWLVEEQQGGRAHEREGD